MHLKSATWWQQSTETCINRAIFLFNGMKCKMSERKKVILCSGKDEMQTKWTDDVEQTTKVKWMRWKSGREKRKNIANYVCIFKYRTN